MSAVIAQGTQEWLDQRKGRVTGSRIGTILGHNPYQKVPQLIREMVREIHGAPSEFVSNADVQRGNDNEGSSIFSVNLETGLDFQQGGFIEHPQYEFLGVSPDAIAKNGNVGLEVKNPRKPQPLSEKPQYYDQIQLCMECTGINKWYYYSDPVEGEPILELVDYDPEWFADALPMIQDFMELLDIEVDNPAHLEPLVEERQDADFENAAHTYHSAKLRLKEAQEAEKAAREKLIELAGDKSCKGFGVTVSRFERAGNVQYKNIPELAGVNLDAYRAKPSFQYRISESE